MINPHLTREIATHILAHLGVISVDWMQVPTSLLSEAFLLPVKVAFSSEEDDKTPQMIYRPVYGCQTLLSNKEIQVLVANCGIEEEDEAFALIVQLKDAPSYAVYYSKEESALIAVNNGGKYWMPCSSYLELTFAAGMETFKDIGTQWIQCQDYQSLYAQLVGFISFRDQIIDNKGE